VNSCTTAVGWLGQTQRQTLSPWWCNTCWTSLVSEQGRDNLDLNWMRANKLYYAFVVIQTAFVVIQTVKFPSLCSLVWSERFYCRCKGSDPFLCVDFYWLTLTPMVESWTCKWIKLDINNSALILWWKTRNRWLVYRKVWLRHWCWKFSQRVVTGRSVVILSPSPRRRFTGTRALNIPSSPRPIPRLTLAPAPYQLTTKCHNFLMIFKSKHLCALTLRN